MFGPSNTYFTEKSLGAPDICFLKSKNEFKSLGIHRAETRLLYANWVHSGFYRHETFSETMFLWRGSSQFLAKADNWLIQGKLSFWVNCNWEDKPELP